MQTDNFMQTSKKLKGGLVRKLINTGKGVKDVNLSKILNEDPNSSLQAELGVGGGVGTSIPTNKDSKTP